jgi:hypothetical protein
MPKLAGLPVRISFRPNLTAFRGQLLSGDSRKGTAVYAAAFLRERRIVLEYALLRHPGKLRMIVVHELFHFVWLRLGNPMRHEFAALLTHELQHGARGELGESSSLKKERLGPGDRGWLEYVCESFCDTAAWCYSGIPRSSQFTLAERWRTRRRHWFRSAFAQVRNF